MPTSGPVYGCCLLSLFLVSNTCAKELEYNRDIRPILAEQCFACHGPDSAARKADLRLDQRDAAIDMASIVPGDPEDSELIRRIMSDDPDELMPPPETKKSLTPEQKQAVHDWSDQIKPLSADRLRNRERALTEFKNLLTKRRHDPDFKENFVALLVDFDHMRAPDYQKKINYNTEVTFRLLMKIDRSLKPTQRVYLLKRIGSLASDFEKLSCDPLRIKP